jgi:hypothetical protein
MINALKKLGIGGSYFNTTKTKYDKTLYRVEKN